MKFFKKCIIVFTKEKFEFLNAYLLLILKKICPIHILWTCLKYYVWPTVVNTQMCHTLPYVYIFTSMFIIIKMTYHDSQHFGS
jgi:hypothetical protein